MRWRKCLFGLIILFGVLLLVPFALLLLFLRVNETNGTIDSGGWKRRYFLYVPTRYKPGKPTPLVISLHGFSEWPAHQAQISGWNELAEEKGFIVVYPSGTGAPLRWNSSELPAGKSRPDDVQFISDLINQLSQDYTIDPNRIYVNGLSNGGGMSFLLSCRLSDRIAAWGGVAGAYSLPWDQCAAQRQVPAILFHGTSDRIVPFNGRSSSSFPYLLPDITNWAGELAKRNGCASPPIHLDDQGEVSGVRYPGCLSGADVVYYTVHSGGHTWPGGGYLPAIIAGKTTKDIKATRVMWEFFDEHPLHQ